MIRFASFGTNQLTQAHMLATQTRMFETQMQIVSGKVSRSYSGVAIDSRRLVNLENSVSEVNGFIKNIDVIESRLQMMENSVAGAFDVATRIRDLLINALNADNAASLSLNQRAEDFLQELTGAINVKQDNRFLFSGSRIDVPPININVLLGKTIPLADAAEFTGTATASTTGITGLTGISKVRVETGTTGDAFQVEFNSGTNTFTVTNLNGGATDTAVVSSVPAVGQTSDITFTLGGKKLVLTIDENFSLSNSITTDTIVGNVDTSGAGVGAFGAVTLTATTGDISKINLNTIETSGTAASATLTLSSTDGNFVATGINLSAGPFPSTVPVTLTNATTGATITLSIDVTTGLNDAAIADVDTEIRLVDFFENVAASNGAVNVADARPGDPGYDEKNPGFYEGDNASLSARIDPNATVNYGITANEAGFEKLFRALYLVHNASATAGNIDRATLESALGLTIDAIRDIPEIRSRIGSDRLAIERMKNRHLDFVVYTRESVNQIESVDITAAVARLSTNQVQLEASYMLTARLSQLTLAKFLR